MPRKKVARSSEIKKRTVYRDSYNRFCTKENRVREEEWTYRTDKNKPGKILDLKIDALPHYHGEVAWYPSLSIPSTGPQAGKFIYDIRSKKKSPLQNALKGAETLRTDSRIEISMTAKTKAGKIIKRKLSFYHFGGKKLEENTVHWILQELFYNHGDRPAYPVKIVKGLWRNRLTTKKETTKRRQLYDVTLHIKTEVETRFQGKMKKRRAKKK